MLAAIGDEDEAQQKPSGSSLQQQQQQRPGKVQLDKFWPQAPNAWFATAGAEVEGGQHHRRERERFAHAVGAMGFSVLRTVMDLMEHPQLWIPTPLSRAAWCWPIS